MRLKLLFIALAASLTCLSASHAAENLPASKQNDSIPNLLENLHGKRVTIRLPGGEELTGTVKRVGKELLHLEELSRREFYDAHIPLLKIDAVIVRTREK